jgi:hypothetical protein
MWEHDYYKNEKERSRNRSKGHTQKKSMKISYVNHVRALMDNYTRHISRHTYSNKEGNQEKKANKLIILINTETIN